MGIFTLLAGLIIFPPAVKFIKNRTHFELSKALKVVAFLVLLGIGGALAGTSSTSTASTPSASNQQNKPNSASSKPEPTATSVSKQPDVPTEYKSALSQATSYANTMHMSKQGVYDQLVSEYGGKFSPAAAQYGIDNVKADWNANALAKAKNYQDSMHMSPAAIHDQLTSAYGEKFTQSEADYAIQHLND
ncbi:Ltp family lipoprotein [Candidatus Daviesbacteria bacterium]|nr:Ltp family lipoprotein [Candidatus Daviesbacteria bacterium]